LPAKASNASDAGSGTTVNRSTWRPSLPIATLGTKDEPLAVCPTAAALFVMRSAASTSKVLPSTGSNPPSRFTAISPARFAAPVPLPPISIRSNVARSAISIRNVPVPF